MTLFMLILKMCAEREKDTTLYAEAYVYNLKRWQAKRGMLEIEAISNA